MSQISECCLKGFRWGEEPKGAISKLASHDCYIAGSNPDAAVLIITDLYGWTFPNTRLVADHFAEEADVTVYVPDFFDGEILDFDLLSGDRKNWGPLDLPGWLSRNSKDKRTSQIIECAKTLRAQYKKLGAIGFCYGGWAVFMLGGEGRNLVDCISTAHPTMLEKEEIKNVRVPVQIMAPEIDPQFTKELKAFSNEVIPTLGVPYDYQYFPGLEHAFATRGDPNNIGERKGMERAKGAAVHWFRQWLHDTK